MLNKILITIFILTLHILNLHAFDAHDHKIFSENEPSLLAKYSCFLKNKEPNDATFKTLCSLLARERQKIAERCAENKVQEFIKTAEKFGKSRIGMPDGLYTTLFDFEKDRALCNIYTEKFLSCFKNGIFEHPVSINNPWVCLRPIFDQLGIFVDFDQLDFSSEKVISTKKETYSLMYQILMFRNKYILSDLKPFEIYTIDTLFLHLYRSPQNHTEIFDALVRNRLRQIKLTYTTTLNQEEIQLCGIYSFIEVPKNEKTFNFSAEQFKDLIMKTKFSLVHTREPLILPLMQKATTHWKNAMQINPQYTPYAPGAFLKQVGYFYWWHSHATPYFRGSESILKWIVELTARYHEKTIVYPTNYVFRLPFGMSCEDFVIDFITQVRVEDFESNDF